MIRQLLIIAAASVTTPAYAAMPVFAAKCGAHLNVDTNPAGQVYMNGKVAKTRKSANGQISGNSAGAWVDINPRGDQPPLVTYTAKDKSTGECEILSFQAAGSAAAPARQQSAGISSRASGDIPCAMGKGKPMGQCPFTVEREGNGSAIVSVTLPDGRKRAIFFEKGKATGADLSQADGDMTFKASKKSDVFYIQAGKERYEIVEAVVFGG